MLIIALAKCFSYYDQDEEELTLVRAAVGCEFDYKEEITISVLIQEPQRITRLPFYREWRGSNVEIKMDNDYEVFAVFVHSPKYVEQIETKRQYATGLLLFGACGIALVLTTLAIVLGVSLCCKCAANRMKQQKMQVEAIPYNEHSTGVSASDVVPLKFAQSPSLPEEPIECAQIVPPQYSV